MSLRSLWRGTCLVAALAAFLPAAAPAAAPGLAEALREIATTGRVLVVTAHPDDENNAALAALARGRGLRVVLLTLTRGEGGQNAIGPHRGDALGVVRTAEALAARRIDGAEQMFGRSVDFGHSFSVDESLARWGSEAALGDVVRAVRLVRPDVILTLPLQSGEGGQHHQAAARLAREAFRAAADPSRFPEHAAAGLRPWQAAKIYEGGVGGAPFAGSVSILTSVPDPAGGGTWQDVGQRARAAHRTQGSPPLPAADPRFSLVDSALPAPVPEADPLDGIDVSLPGLLRTVRGDRAGTLAQPGLDTIAGRVHAATAAFDAAAPGRAVPALRTALEALRHWREKIAALPAGPGRAELLERLDEREPRFERALALAHGVELRADVDDVTATPGQTLGVLVSVRNRGPAAVRVERLELASGGRWPVQGGFTPGSELAPGGSLAARVVVTVPADAPPSQPHWRRERGSDRVGLLQPALEGRAFAPAELTARLQYTSGGVGARLEAPVGAETAGRWSRVSVVPALTVTPLAPVVLVANAPKPSTFEVEIGAADHTKSGGPARLRLVVPDRWRVEPELATLGLAGEGPLRTVRFRVTAPARVAPGPLVLPVELTRGDRRFTDALQVVDVPELEPRRLYTAASLSVLAVAVRTAPSARVGVLLGADDGVAAAMRALGVHVTGLPPERLPDLRGFTTVLVATRAFDLATVRAAAPRLVDYARGGGHVVVLQQRPDTAGDAAGLLPFAGAFTRGRVTDETSPVRVADDSPVLNTPNRLEAEDWAGWVQERAVYLLEPRDKAWRDVLVLADPFPRNAGEKRGALTEASVGRGTWTYVALALPRQLEASVPGAFRLLANLVARPRR